VRFRYAASSTFTRHRHLQENSDFHYEILNESACASWKLLNNGAFASGRAHRQRKTTSLAPAASGLCRLHQQGQEPSPNVFAAMGDRQSDQGTNIGVEVAMQWNSGYSEQVLCFTNNIPAA
jgi:DNA gyrase subunit B